MKLDREDYAVGDSRYMQSILLDFYGDLLTDKQRECFDLHYNEDLSLAEIAEQSGISRQAVWDNIRRAESALQQIEEKTGLAERFSETQKALEKLSTQVQALENITNGRAQELARGIAAGIDELLNKG